VQPEQWVNPARSSASRAISPSPNLIEALETFVRQLDEREAHYIVDEEIAAQMKLHPRFALPVDRIPDHAGLLMSFGGDGTLLRSVHRVGARRVPILGVNLGPGLGYLTELRASELPAYLDRISQW